MISERKREMIVNWARSGYTVEQIAGPLRLDQQVVKSIIEGGYRELPTPRPNVECTPGMPGRWRRARAAGTCSTSSTVARPAWEMRRRV